MSDFEKYLTAKLKKYLVNTSVSVGELSLEIKRDSIVEALKFLRDDLRCKYEVLIDLCGVDYPERVGAQGRFEVVYNLLSIKHNRRLRVKVATDEKTPVPSATPVYSAAGWYEREAWDLYGILFADHPDLRRLLTDYGFRGHPLRKDFPLTGYVEVRYDDEQKRVVYDNVELTQGFRSFDFLSPWEGAKYILPGDEKAAPSTAKKKAS